MSTAVKPKISFRIISKNKYKGETMWGKLPL